MDEKLGRTVTRVVLPRVVMHSRYHYAVNYTTFLSPTKQFFLSACCPFHLKKRARINFPPFRLSFVHKMKGQNWQSIYEFLCTGLFWQFYWFRARRWGRTRYIRFCRSPFWLNSSMDICFPFILIFMCYGKEGIINVLYKICLVI